MEITLTEEQIDNLVERLTEVYRSHEVVAEILATINVHFCWCHPESQAEMDDPNWICPHCQDRGWIIG